MVFVCLFLVVRRRERTGKRGNKKRESNKRGKEKERKNEFETENWEKQINR